MGATIAQKILARTSGRTSVESGEIVWANADAVRMRDTRGLIQCGSGMEFLGLKVWIPTSPCRLCVSVPLWYT